MKELTTSITGVTHTISLNRPDKGNTLNREMIQAFIDALNAAKDDPDCLFVLLTSSSTTFCSGAESTTETLPQPISFAQHLEASSLLMKLYKKLYFHPKITIAEINGHAFNDGSGLVAACDFAFAAEEVLFGFTEPQFGAVAAIAMPFLTRKTGERHARELLLSGQRIDARKACACGLINDVFSSVDLQPFTKRFVNEMTQHCSPQSLLQTKEMLSNIVDMETEDALAYAVTVHAESHMSAGKKGTDRI